MYTYLCRLPEGLEDVSKYPDLFAELVMRGWSEEDMEKVAGRNMVRAFRGVEAVSVTWSEPSEGWRP